MNSLIDCFIVVFIYHPVYLRRDFEGISLEAEANRAGSTEKVAIASLYSLHIEVYYIVMLLEVFLVFSVYKKPAKTLQDCLNQEFIELGRENAVLRATIFRAFVMQLLNIGMNFGTVLQRVKSVKNMSLKHLLKFYPFFMQATVSPCETDKPSSFDVDEAKRKYTEFVETLMSEPFSNDANLLDNNVVYENSTSQEETTPEKEEYSSSRKVLLEDKGKIFRILLNRSEKKNALTHEMYRDIMDGLKSTEKSEAFITVFEENPGNMMVVNEEKRWLVS
ncbi:Enoyl-CoA delta isomerase 2, mitochondrial [Trichinella zimbabwensis]|uniref:Enoyl-CoA delta isomerase 2, mitochondrial n=1 Tax=Trichinella zimbabwensis TaxID=268475 RepID=A0A0V1HT28_9BILA|nr:Enoyl-CoA delta isomerase 2, mitochondrial [Trichinella zimbabwensis]